MPLHDSVFDQAESGVPRGTMRDPGITSADTTPASQ
jgi:hypothetical protein